MAQGVFTPYSTVAAFIKTPTAWVPKEEQERVAAYGVYEEIYWSAPESFRLTLRGDEEAPIYLPSGRIIVDAMDRYFGRRPQITWQATNTATKDVLDLALKALFRRERFWTKFAAAKKDALRLGDMVLHILADPMKPAGQRLRLLFVDPRSYFPVTDPNDPDRIIKVHLADQVLQDDGSFLIRRQTYTRLDNGLIETEAGMYEMEGWQSATVPKVVLVPKTVLPQSISAIPVYAWQNNYENGNPYGSSEMRGLEVLMRAINQAVTDEDVALALEGLGVYKSGAGAPVDEETGEESTWVLGPGRVVEDDTFERVNGIGTVTPYTEHIETIWRFMKMGSGTPESAIGKVDVQVAESGVALALDMAPMVARAEEKNGTLAEWMEQVLWGLQMMWFPAYESITVAPEDALPSLAFADALPTNRKAEVDLAVQMVISVPPIMSAASAREWLALRGIQFAPDEFARIMQEKEAFAETAEVGAPEGGTDDYAARVREELSGGSE